MAKRTEPEIMKHWKNKEKPLVSVCCITYNHESYIRDAIEGFLMQKTTFPFEIIIHDDASTDHTAEIVREYEKKYPNIIKPIYQKENQYSQRKSISSTFVRPRAKGDYLALCEGDDYWTDPLKLQIQARFLEKHPEFFSCFHRAKKIDENGVDIGTFWPEENWNNKITGLDDILERNYISTQTVMFRRKKLNEKLFKSISHGLYFGDWVLHTLGAMEGKIYFINKIMAAYRVTDSGATKSTPLERRIRDISTFYDRMEALLGKSNSISIRKFKAMQIASAVPSAMDFSDKGYAKKLLKESFDLDEWSLSNLGIRNKALLAVFMPHIFVLLRKIKRYCGKFRFYKTSSFQKQIIRILRGY